MKVRVYFNDEFPMRTCSSGVNKHLVEILAFGPRVTSWLRALKRQRCHAQTDSLDVNKVRPFTWSKKSNKQDEGGEKKKKKKCCSNIYELPSDSFKLNLGRRQLQVIPQKSSASTDGWEWLRGHGKFKQARESRKEDGAQLSQAERPRQVLALESWSQRRQRWPFTHNSWEGGTPVTTVTKKFEGKLAAASSTQADERFLSLNILSSLSAAAAGHIHRELP